MLLPLARPRPPRREVPGSRAIRSPPGIMRIALWIEDAIAQTMACGPRSVERLQQVMPAIETHPRVTRQVDRFAQIELRAAESHKPKSNGDTAAVEHLEVVHTLPIGQSEDSAV